jgi:hypothetical protein
VSGDVNYAYGFSKLKNVSSDEPSIENLVCFAVDFDTDEVEKLLALVKNTKGWAEWNGEVIGSD